jgi:hypothetical protein
VTETTNNPPEMPNNLDLNPTKLYYNVYTTSKFNIKRAPIGKQEVQLLKIHFLSP